MELALLLPLVILCGFIFCNRSRSHFYKLHRYSDQYLYLTIATKGFYVVLTSAILTFITYKLASSEYIHIAANAMPSSLILQFTDLLTLNSKEADIHQVIANESIQLKSLIMLALSAISILISYTAAILFNFRLNYPTPIKQISRIIKLYTNLIFLGIATTKASSTRQKIKTESSKRRLASRLSAITRAIQDRPLDQYFLSASRSQKIVAITLDTNKVYVGIILSPGEVNESEGLGPEIMIYPIASGYRDTADQQLTLTTEYPDSEDNAVFIKMDRITTVSNFNPDLYDTVKPNKNTH